MNHRRHGTVPALALWVLVVVGNMAMIVANAGLTVVIATFGRRLRRPRRTRRFILRRGHAAPARVPVAVPARRRPLA